MQTYRIPPPASGHAFCGVSVRIKASSGMRLYVRTADGQPVEEVDATIDTASEPGHWDIVVAHDLNALAAANAVAALLLREASMRCRPGQRRGR